MYLGQLYMLIIHTDFASCLVVLFSDFCFFVPLSQCKSIILLRLNKNNQLSIGLMYQHVRAENWSSLAAATNPRQP